MKTLLVLSLMAMGTLSTGAYAADEGAVGAPRCENVEGGMVCDNLSNEQSLALTSNPEAYRRCYRECAVRIFRFCPAWHVVCRDFGRHCGWDRWHRWSCDHGRGWDNGWDHGRRWR